MLEKKKTKVGFVLGIACWPGAVTGSVSEAMRYNLMLAIPTIGGGMSLSFFLNNTATTETYTTEDTLSLHDALPISKGGTHARDHRNDPGTLPTRRGSGAHHRLYHRGLPLASSPRAAPGGRHHAGRVRRAAGAVRRRTRGGRSEERRVGKEC